MGDELQESGASGRVQAVSLGESGDCVEMKLMNPARHVQSIFELTALYSVFDIWSCGDLAALLSGVAKPTYIHEPLADYAAM